jgi:hypothetical protein
MRSEYMNCLAETDARRFAPVFTDDGQVAGIISEYWRYEKYEPKNNASAPIGLRL